VEAHVNWPTAVVIVAVIGLLSAIATSAPELFEELITAVLALVFGWWIFRD
jgi:hypothetical protein